MLHQKEPHELALASTAVLLHLLQRLVDDKLLKRETALTILGNAADASQGRRFDQKGARAEGVIRLPSGLVLARSGY